MNALHSRRIRRRQSRKARIHMSNTPILSRPHAKDRRRAADARSEGRGSELSDCREPPRSGACRQAALRASREDMTMLRDDINNAVKDAMRAKDERKLSTLRMVNSTIKNADIAARGEGKPPLTDADLLGVFQKMIKQRQESVELY